MRRRSAPGRRRRARASFRNSRQASQASGFHQYKLRADAGQQMRGHDRRGARAPAHAAAPRGGAPRSTPRRRRAGRWRAAGCQTSSACCRGALSSTSTARSGCPALAPGAGRSLRPANGRAVRRSARHEPRPAAVCAKRHRRAGGPQQHQPSGQSGCQGAERRLRDAQPRRLSGRSAAAQRRPGPR